MKHREMIKFGKKYTEKHTFYSLKELPDINDNILI